MVNPKFKAWDNINECWINIFKIVIAVDGSFQGVESIEGESYGPHQINLTIDILNVHIKTLETQAWNQEAESTKASVDYVKTIDELTAENERLRSFPKKTFKAENKRLRGFLQYAINKLPMFHHGGTLAGSTLTDVRHTLEQALKEKP